jgi:putative addiction module killer protein
LEILVDSKIVALHSWSYQIQQEDEPPRNLDKLSFIRDNALIEVRQTDVFADWFAGLRDREGRARIAVRIRRLSLGNPSDAKPVGSGVSEMRIDYGPGYRVYFVRRGDAVVVLLCGGDKRHQDRDIARALELAQEV